MSKSFLSSTASLLDQHRGLKRSGKRQQCGSGSGTNRLKRAGPGCTVAICKAHPVYDMNDVHAVLDAARIGQPLKISVIRGG